MKHIDDTSFNGHFRGCKMKNVYFHYLSTFVPFTKYQLSDSQVFDNKRIVGIQTYGSYAGVGGYTVADMLPPGIVREGVTYDTLQAWFYSGGTLHPAEAGYFVLVLKDKFGNVRCNNLPLINNIQEPGALFPVRAYDIEGGIYSKNCQIFCCDPGFGGGSQNFVIPITFFYEP